MPGKNTEHYFLSGGGEMGKLIRAKDWSKTSLGDPKDWPQSLRTMVAVMLDNPFGMYIAWGTEYIQLYNDGYRPILGATKHPQALGTGTRETFAEIWHIIESMFDGVMKGKAVGFPDFMLPLNRNGFVEECYFDFSYSPIRKEDGEVGGILVTVIETTDKKKAEEDLKKSEARFRTMADNIPNLAWMANADGWIYWYNKKWYDFTGTTAAQMEGWGWQSVHDPKQLPAVLDKWKKSIETGEPFEMVFPLRSAAGKFRQFLTRVLPMRNSEGKIYQWFGSNTDITDQKEAEGALKESEMRFRTMAESSDILIAISDATGNAIYFNKAWNELTGRTAGDLLKFSWADLIHADDRQGFVAIYLDAFEKREHWSGEFRVLNKEGGYNRLFAKGAPRFQPDGMFGGYISSCIDITEQVKALEKLKESEHDLRNIVLDAPIGICVLDAASLTSEIVNDSFIEVAGKPYEAIAGKYYWDTFAEARPYYESALNAVVEEGKPFYANEVELMLVRHGKEEIIYVTFVYAPLKNAEGKVMKVAIWVLENTMQVKARQKIEEAEKKATLAINSAELGVYEILYASDEMITDKRFNEIWGFDKQGSRNQYAAAIHPDDLLQRAEAHKVSLVTGQLDYQARVIWKDKSIHWVKVTGTVDFDNKGNPSKLIGVAQDVTAPVIAQKEIEESERNIRNMIVQAPVAMCIFRGASYVVEIANNEMFELWGKKENEILDKPIFEGLPEAKEQGLEQSLLNVYLTGERFTANERPVNLPRNGRMELVYVNFVFEAMKQGDDSISGILAVAIDVTQQVIARQKIEESESKLRILSGSLEKQVLVRTAELEQKNIALEKMNKELQSFAYISSHDLQEPLRKIQTFSSQIIEKELDNLSESGKDKFKRMQNAAKRMQTLIEDLLTYSRTSTAERKFETTDLSQILDEVKEDLKEELQQKNASIETAGFCEVNIIPFQFRQLMYNLISNSLKFSKNNLAPHIKIESKIGKGANFNNENLEKEIKYCHISVSDNGIGFEPKYSEKIFEVFQRLHGKNQYDGTGIGLAIVRKIVENHNGVITADAEPDNGATFDIYIPAERPENLVL
jgi:PAS domain S-box-containing protein